MGPVQEGVSGVYLVSGENDEMKIFKPACEEGYIESKSTENGRESLKSGVVYGEASQKELAAYLLDHDRFAGVPHTELVCVELDSQDAGSVHVPCPSFGSLQDFQKHKSSCEDMGTARFTADSVHRLGILDVRLLNLDRHLGNILVTEDDKLVPIDHAYVLPSCKNLGEITFEWLYWPQCKVPFSREAVDYILSLNPQEDEATLRSIGISDDCITSYHIATVFLQLCVRRGMNLFQIASKIQRAVDGEPSYFEQIVDHVLKNDLPSRSDQESEMFDLSDNLLLDYSARVEAAMRDLNFAV